MNGNDDRSRRIAEAARRLYHDPPETPREEMWASIERRLDAGSARQVRPLPWWLGIAAALVIGLGIGRMTLPDGESGTATTADATATPAAETGPTVPRSPTSYDVATRRHLDQTELLLVGLRADLAEPESRIDVAPRARALLSRTRLLLDSPASRDAETKRLLEDIELLLAQVAIAAEGEDMSEDRFLGRQLSEGGVLRRLRSNSNAAKKETTRGLTAASL